MNESSSTTKMKIWDVWSKSIPKICEKHKKSRGQLIIAGEKALDGWKNVYDSADNNNYEMSDFCNSRP